MRKILTSLLLFCLMFSGAKGQEPSQPVIASLESILQSTASLKVEGVSLNKKALKQLYERFDWQYLWLENGKGNGRFKAFVFYLDTSDSHGLDNRRYKVTEIHRRLRNPTAYDESNTELLISAMLLRYIQEVKRGVKPPRQYLPSMYLYPNPINPVQILQSGIISHMNGYAFFANIHPPFLEYQQLRNLLASLRRIRATGGFINIPQGEMIKSGAVDPRMPLIHKRLIQEGLLPDKKVDENMVYTSSLEYAIRRFQRQRGLLPDGVVGGKTLIALNQSVDSLMNKVIVNLERWRWLPEDLGRKHIRVNIAGFELRAYEDYLPTLYMYVVAGKKEHSTPMMNTMIKDVIFHPSWYVPDSIAKRSIIPRALANPNFLRQNHFTVMRVSGNQAIPVDKSSLSSADIASGEYKFRQSPGTFNALGKVRFSINNNKGIYLHGTPNVDLFSRDVRAYSSGCIRVEDPLSLMYFVMEGTKDWDRERIRKYYRKKGGTKRVKIAHEVPVYIMYHTAWVDPAGNIHFRDDLYKRDTPIGKALGI